MILRITIPSSGDSYMKTFVIDTNVLLHFPNALLSFDDNKVVLTDTVIEELDNHKEDRDEKGVNARTVGRLLKNLRVKGKLSDGVKLDNGGTLITVNSNTNIDEMPAGFDVHKHDNLILKTCKELSKKDETVIFVSNDILASVKAESFGVMAQEFQSGRAPKTDKQYTGRLSACIDDNVLENIIADKPAKISDINLYKYDEYIESGEKVGLTDEIYPNEFLNLKGLSGRTILAKVDYTGEYIEKLEFENDQPFGLIPRNSVQKFMLEALLTDVNKIPLVILKGPAGVAKTLCSLAAGLQHVSEEHKYRKILLCRPAVTMGEDLGYLPGTEKEKIAPYMRSAIDNLEVLVDSSPEERYKNEEELNDKITDLMEHGYIDMQAIGFLRGRSIAQQFIIVDESQNISPAQAKAIVTRAGEDTKIVFCGDAEQVDADYLDSTNNGLSWLAEKMKGSPLCAQVSANENECVRSKLAEDAIKRLK